MESCDPVKGCVCNKYFSGLTCSEDIDECTVTPTICGSDKICRNIENGYECDCLDGFQKEKSTCVGKYFIAVM